MLSGVVFISFRFFCVPFVSLLFIFSSKTMFVFVFFFVLGCGGLGLFVCLVSKGEYMLCTQSSIHGQGGKHLSCMRLHDTKLLWLDN